MQRCLLKTKTIFSKIAHAHLKGVVERRKVSAVEMNEVSEIVDFSGVPENGAPVILSSAPAG